MNKACCWVLRPNSPGVSAIYCGKLTDYHMVRDDDGVLRRKHEPFCPKHTAQLIEEGEE